MMTTVHHWEKDMASAQRWLASQERIGYHGEIIMMHHELYEIKTWR